MLVAEAVNPRPGQTGLDACARRGNHHLAEKMENRGRIVACDIHPHKLRLIEENTRRLGISIVEVRHADARDLTGVAEEPFDFVLLDAPCSGLGVIRRKPDIKWRKETRDIDGVAACSGKCSPRCADGSVRGERWCTAPVRWSRGKTRNRSADSSRTTPNLSWTKG